MSLRGTTMTLRGVLPSSSATIFGSASASALSAFSNVYIGPPKSPGCCPVVTTMPFAAATRSSRSAAAPDGSSAGRRPASQRLPSNSLRTFSACAFHAA